VSQAAEGFLSREAAFDTTGHEMKSSIEGAGTEEEEVVENQGEEKEVEKERES